MLHLLSDFVLILPSTQHHSFFRKLPPLIQSYRLNRNVGPDSRKRRKLNNEAHQIQKHVKVYATREKQKFSISRQVNTWVILNLVRNRYIKKTAVLNQGFRLRPVRLSNRPCPRPFIFYSSISQVTRKLGPNMTRQLQKLGPSKNKLFSIWLALNSSLYNKYRQNWPYRVFIKIPRQVFTVVWIVKTLILRPFQLQQK